LIIVNAIVYFGQRTIPDLTEWGALHYWKSPLFKPHQIITHMFMHDPQSILHILFNMLVLWMFGAILENYWGAKRFINFYMICGIGAAIAQMVMIPWEVTRAVHAAYPPELWDEAIQFQLEHFSMMGASGAIMGVMAAFAYLFPNTELLIFLVPIPVKAKYLIPIYVLIDIFGGISGGDNVAHFAHLGGALVGILLVIFQNRNNRRNFY